MINEFNLGDCSRRSVDDFVWRERLMGGWYEKVIEEPIRPLVKLLRDNGFNTTSSCGHEPYVEMESYLDNEITRLHDLLLENGYHEWTIQLNWQYRQSFGFNQRNIRITLEKNKTGVIK